MLCEWRARAYRSAPSRGRGSSSQREFLAQSHLMQNVDFNIIISLRQPTAPGHLCLPLLKPTSSRMTTRLLLLSHATPPSPRPRLTPSVRSPSLTLVNLRSKTRSTSGRDKGSSMMRRLKLRLALVLRSPRRLRLLDHRLLLSLAIRTCIFEASTSLSNLRILLSPRLLVFELVSSLCHLRTHRL